MISDRLPSISALELLDAIARTGSMTLAGGEAGITQQAVSRRISRLEQSLGRDLVSRGSRASRLTTDGAELLSLARPLLRAAAEMDSALDDLLRAPRSLSVAASLTIADHFLPLWIRTYVENGNDPRLLHSRSTNTREVVRLVSDSVVDLGFVEGSEPPKGLRYKFIAHDELAVYVAPGHPWAARGHISPWTLAGTPLVTREEGSGCRAVILAALQQHGVLPSEFAPPALELTSNTAVLEAAAANVAPIAISVRAAASFLRDSRLVRVGIDRTVFRRELGAIWGNSDVPQTPVARALLLAAETAGGNENQVPKHRQDSSRLDSRR